jgi:hypothetical protein
MEDSAPRERETVSKTEKWEGNASRDFIPRGVIVKNIL